MSTSSDSSDFRNEITDQFLNFHFQNFNIIIKKQSDEKLTEEIEDLINEIREKLKNAYNEENDDYTEYCHYLDKAFDDYLESKREVKD